MIYLKRVKSLQESHNKKWKLADRSGQATMEYILLLVITVSLILSLTGQFFTPFKRFINNYMGDYVSCLLETGEFPSTGGSATDSECDFKFEPATLANGRPPAQTGNRPNDEISNENSRDRNSGSSGSNGAQGSYAGSAGRNESYLSGPPPRVSSGDTAGASKVVEISIGSGEESGFNTAGTTSAYNSTSASRPKPVISYGLTTGEQKKVEEEKKGAARVIASDLPGKPSKKVLLKPSTSADVIKDEKIEEWNLGDYFRFLLIAAIIILLIAVIGGQAAKLSKSWE